MRHIQFGLARAALQRLSRRELCIDRGIMEKLEVKAFVNLPSAELRAFDA